MDYVSNGDEFTLLYNVCVRFSLTSLKKLTLSIVNKFSLRSLNRFFPFVWRLFLPAQGTFFAF